MNYQNPNGASLAIINAKIWTVNQNQPWAEAIAIYRNQIIAVGSNAEIHRYISNETNIIDAQGKFVLPGFNDAHVHFSDGAFSLIGVDLRDAKNEQDFASRIGDYTQKVPNGTWIMEGNWNHENWPGQKHPAKELIDNLTLNHPVFVSRIDYHIALANSLALKLAGIDRDTPNPPGGEICKDPKTGEPTGILIDKAWDLILKIVPPHSIELRKKTFKNALNHLAGFGVTSFQDNSSKYDMQAYQELLKEGNLTARVNAWFSTENYEILTNLGIQSDFGNDMLRLGTLKIYADGSMGAGSALFYEPYSDDPSTCGLALNTEEELISWITKGDAANLQLAIHAIGDKANTHVLNALEIAHKQNGERNRRHRIEHAQVVLPQDLQRYKFLNLIASIQPSHLIDDMQWAEKRIGFERCENAYMVNSFFKNNIKVAFGTDWPVEAINPLLGIYAAVTREDSSGKPDGGWFPKEKTTLAKAIEAYTIGAAFAEFAEHKKGSIEPGKLADIIVLSDNLFDVPPSQMLNTKILYTICDGRIVFQRN